jgi:acetyltransferase-like isoleucine patch superfamily enzyme
MLKRILQVMAFFFPAPLNVWLHRLAGARIGGHVNMHPCVLILAKDVEIGHEAKIKFGTMIHVRRFRLGRKSSIGFFTLVKGMSDLMIDDACIIGPRNTINCDRPITLDYYSGVGPGSYLYTHGSGMPVTEGYRATFAPIRIKEKVWVNMKSTVGPGVTIGKGSIVMPGTVLIESVAPGRMVVGDPAKLINIPVFLVPRKACDLEKLTLEILSGFCQWSNEYRGTDWRMEGGILTVNHRRRLVKISVNGPGDIVLLTEKGAAGEGMYFNMADLRCDGRRHPVKKSLEEYMRLNYGLIFL